MLKTISSAKCGHLAQCFESFGVRQLGMKTLTLLIAREGMFWAPAVQGGRIGVSSSSAGAPTWEHVTA